MGQTNQFTITQTYRPDHFFPFPKEIRLGYLILPITSTNNLCNSKFQDHNYDMFLGEQNKPMPLYHILIMHACEPGKKKKSCLGKLRPFVDQTNKPSTKSMFGNREHHVHSINLYRVNSLSRGKGLKRLQWSYAMVLQKVRIIWDIGRAHLY